MLLNLFVILFQVENSDEWESSKTDRKFFYQPSKTTPTYKSEFVLGNEVQTFNKKENQKNLNVEVASFIGISQALMDHVVICHPRDSCWPLEMDSGVKKNFDRILQLGVLEKKINETMEIISIKEKGLTGVRGKKETAEVVKKSADDKMPSYKKHQEEIEKLAKEIKAHDEELLDFEWKVEALKPVDTDLNRRYELKGECLSR